MKTSNEYQIRDSRFFSKNQSACDGLETEQLLCLCNVGKTYFVGFEGHFEHDFTTEPFDC